MFAILGEDESDAETVKAIVMQVVGKSIRIKTRGFGGKNKMLDRGAAQIHFFRDTGSEKFIICHDSDSADPSGNHARVTKEIVKPSGLEDSCCIVIPVT